MTVAKQSTDTAEARYYVTHDGQVRGPFDLDLIEAMVLSGNFSPDVPVCKVGTKEWLPLPPSVQTLLPLLALTGEQPSESSRSGGWKSGLVVAGVIVIPLVVGALISNQSKSGPQQKSEQPALTYKSSPTPPPITPTYTPPAKSIYRDPAGTTYSIPQWADQMLAAKKAALNAQEASVNSLKSQVKALGNQIETERTYLDQTNQYAIDEFNRGVDRYNTLNQQLKDGIDTFNASVNDYNAELARVGTPIN